jgi:hypothetical protein
MAARAYPLQAQALQLVHLLVDVEFAVILYKVGLFLYSPK